MRRIGWIGIVVGLGLVGWLVLRRGALPSTQEGAVESAAPAALEPEPRDVDLPEAATIERPSRPAPETRRVGVSTASSHEFDGYVARGRVLGHDGRPVELTRVRVWEWEDPEFYIEDYEPFSETVECSGDGGFEVRVDRQGEFRIWARAEGSCSSEVLELRLNPRTPEADVELRLARATFIRGRVVDAEGKPVPRVAVHAFVDVERYAQSLPDGLTNEEYWGTPAELTDQEGRFVLTPVDARAIGYELWCRARRFGSLSISRPDGTLRTTRHATFAEATRVAPGSEAVELVLGEWSDSGAKASLDVTVEGGGAPPDRLSCIVRRVGPRGSIYHSWSTGAVPDEHGSAPVEDLLPGARYVIQIQGQVRGAVVESDPFVAMPGVVSVPIQLPRAIPVEIQVFGSDGEVPSRAKVTLDAIGTLNQKKVWGRTNVDRWPIRLKLPAGIYEVNVVGDRNESCSSTLVVDDDPVELRIELPK